MSNLEAESCKDTSKHQLLNLRREDDLRQFLELKKQRNIEVKDFIDSQIKDLIKLRNPTLTINSSELEKMAGHFLAENGGDYYGFWVYYPWRNCIVHILPEKEFAEVRTVRNKHKITEEEQKILATKKIGVIGLSVGQSVAIALSLERTFGELRIADFDTLELSNLNRLRAGVFNIGENKTAIVRKEIAEIDPYLKVVAYNEGISLQNIDDFLLKGGALDLLIDECDSLDMKLLMREKAKNSRIPVLMDTSDRGMLDVERFDLEPNRSIFHGFVEGLDYSKLGDLPMKEKIPVVLKITGLETLSSRMKASLLEVNQSITSWPQLASAVFLGGALGAHASRQLLLGKNLKSGRYYVDFDDLLHLNTLPEESFLHESRVEDQLKATITLNENYRSNYQLSINELEELVTYANLAPSGGNVQPWIWIFDERGVLHLLHDQVRSESLLDFQGTGSLIAFGAALENLRIWCQFHGIVHHVHYEIKEFGDKKIASITFLDKSVSPKKTELKSLYDAIPHRLTDRLNQKRKIIPKQSMAQLLALVDSSSFTLKIIEEETEIQKLASINGHMDWVRMINKRGYHDFLDEIRWTPEEAARLKDGIDLATFDFGPAERALMKLISNRNAMEVIRSFKLGQGFTKISDDTFKSASVIAILTGREYTPEAFISAGSMIQQIWLKAHNLGIGFQPVTASLFMYHRYFKGDKDSFSTFEGQLIESSFQELKKVIDSEEEALFMFRLTISEGELVRSWRRPVNDTLKICGNV